MGAPRRRASHAAALALAAALVSGCGGDDREAPPPAQFDLLAQADVAAEVIHGERLQRHLAGLTKDDRAAYVARELHRLGFAPASPRGEWYQVYDVPRQSVQAGPWELARGEARLALQPGRDFVAALGAKATTVRLGGRAVVFADRWLAVPPGSLTGKVVAVPLPVAGAGPPRPVAPGAGGSRPGGNAAQPGGAPPAAVAPAPPAPGAPVTDLIRRAAAAGAVAVVLLPSHGSTAPLPAPAAAGELAAGTGLPVAIWVTEPAARGLFATLLSTGLAFLPQLEGRHDILPLAMGQVAKLDISARAERDRHFNVVASLPARPGGVEEVVAVVAPLGSGAAAAEVGGDPRAEAAALAQLLGVAAACQAVSEPPRRTLILAAVDTSGDGTAGARQLMALAGERRIAAAVVLAGGNVWGPTEDVTFVGMQASPLAGTVQRVAASRGRRLGGDPAPARGVLWRSPAWAFLQAGVPAVLLEPGTLLRQAAPPPGMAMVAAGAPRPAPAPAAVAVDPSSRQAEGMTEDARLAFRLVLELLETPAQLPRVDPEQVQATLRRAPPAPSPTQLPLPARPRRVADGQLPAGAPRTTAAAPTADGAQPSPMASPGAPAGAGAGAAPSIRVERAPGPIETAPPPADDEGATTEPDGPSFLAPPAATVPPPPAPEPRPEPTRRPPRQREEPPADDPAAGEPPPQPQPTAPREGDPDLA